MVSLLNLISYSRAFQIRDAKIVNKDSKESWDDSVHNKPTNDGRYFEKSTKSVDTDLAQESAEEDWEAVADRAANVLLSSQFLPELSNLSWEDTQDQAPKRHGRGTFSYKKNEPYGNWQYDRSVVEYADDEGVSLTSERNPDLKFCTWKWDEPALLET